MSEAWTNAAPGTIVAEYRTAVVTRDMLQRYASASGDLNPLHLDPAFARRAGFDDVIVHGMLGMALLGRLLHEAFPAYPVRTFSTRFGGIIPIDHALHCCARLLERGAAQVTLALEARIADREAIVISGTANLALDHAG